MFGWVENRLLAKGLKYLAHFLLSAYKLSWKNNQLENVRDMVFGKAKGRDRTV